MDAMELLKTFINEERVSELEKINVPSERENGVDGGVYVCVYCDENGDNEIFNFENRFDILSVDEIFKDRSKTIYIGKTYRDHNISCLEKDSTKFVNNQYDYRHKLSVDKHFTHGKICFHFFILRGTSDRNSLYTEDTLFRDLWSIDRKNGLVGKNNKQCLNEVRSVVMKNQSDQLKDDDTELIGMIKASFLHQLKYSNVKVTTRNGHETVTQDIDTYFFEKTPEKFITSDSYAKKQVDQKTIDEIKVMNEEEFITRLIEIDEGADIFEMASSKPLDNCSIATFDTLVGRTIVAPMQSAIIEKLYEKVRPSNVPILKFIPANYRKPKLLKAILEFFRNPVKSSAHDYLLLHKVTYLTIVALLSIEFPFFVRYSVKKTTSFDKRVDRLLMFEDNTLTYLSNIKKNCRDTSQYKKCSVSSASCSNCNLHINYLSYGMRFSSDSQEFGLALITNSGANYLPGHNVNCPCSSFNQQLQIAEYNRLNKFATFAEFKQHRYKNMKTPQHDFERYYDPVENDYTKYLATIVPPPEPSPQINATITISDDSDNNESDEENSPESTFFTQHSWANMNGKRKRSSMDLNQFTSNKKKKI